MDLQQNISAPSSAASNLSTLAKDNQEVQLSEKNSLIQVIQTVAYCILIVLSLIGNTLVIATVVRNTNKRMRSVSNILIVNLSVADLLVSLVNMTSKIAEIHIGDEWLFGGTVGLVLCKIMRLVPFLAVFVSTQSFSVLALDRFGAVYFPVRKPITTKVACILVGLVWMSSIGFYYVYCHSATIVHDGNITLCNIDPNIVFGGNKGFKKFVWVEFAVVVLVPLAVSLVLYVATMVKLWKRKVPGNITLSNASYTERVNRKVLKMLVTVYLVFLFCWLPSWIWIIQCVRIDSTHNLPAFCMSSDFRIFRFIVAYSNSAITPFVYLVYSENYRQGFVDIFVALACCSKVRAVLSRSNRVRPSFSVTYNNMQDRSRLFLPSRRLERLDMTTVI